MPHFTQSKEKYMDGVMRDSAPAAAGDRIENTAPGGKIITLTQNFEFLRTYKRGRSVVHPLIVTYIFKNRLGYTRVGITTSKKIGGAVQRNRARRVIRQAYRALLPQIKPGYDVVFVARGKTPHVKEWAIESAMKKNLKKAGLLKP